MNMRVEVPPWVSGYVNGNEDFLIRIGNYVFSTGFNAVWVEHIKIWHPPKNKDEYGTYETDLVKKILKIKQGGDLRNENEGKTPN